MDNKEMYSSLESSLFIVRKQMEEVEVTDEAYEHLYDEEIRLLADMELLKKEIEKINEFSRVIFCQYIPEELEYGVLYISEEYETANHLCPCGCGRQVPIPISVREHYDLNWEYRRRDDKVTFSPSLLNKHCPNKAHYFVRDNKIDWC